MSKINSPVSEARKLHLLQLKLRHSLTSEDPAAFLKLDEVGLDEMQEVECNVRSLSDVLNSETASRL